MKPTPPGWPRISTAIYYDDPAAAIDWLCDAFGFEVQLKVEGENGAIEHSELVYGDGLIMVGGLKPDRFPNRRTPAGIDGGNTQNLMVYVDDVTAHMARAREHGATVIGEMQESDYGDDYWADRGYECVDVGGHRWWFYERLRTKGQPV
ncbi:MAG: VOC family protein [Sandaracinaceae bacterium]|nr:VOC family protein [Sandaracinaceae bacterium]